MTPEQLRQHGVSNATSQLHQGKETDDLRHQAPFPSQFAGVGGLPTVSIDVPASAVLLAIYASFAVANMYIFQTNRRRGHKFLPSALMFGFCMARILTLVLRISWACYPRSVSTAIAANILVNAGILIVYILNLLFASRILRALQPTIGWNRALGFFYKAMYTLIGTSLVLVIVLTVMSSYTLDRKIHLEAMWIQRGAILFMLIFTLVPAVLLALAVLLPKHPSPETFGHGTMRTKIIVLAVGICLTVTIAGFRAGTTWMAPRPVDNPAWYQSRAAFYCFNFMLEIFILALYVPARIDKRFHVQDGSSKRRTYQKPEEQREESERRDSAVEEERDEEKEKEKRDSGLTGSDV